MIDYRIAIATNWSKRKNDIKKEEYSEDKNDVDESIINNSSSSSIIDED